MEKNNIHPTAIVASQAKIARDVEIGPYCTVGPNVVLEKGVKLYSHVVVDGCTTIGAGTKIYSFSSIGSDPQNIRYQGEKTELFIGKNNVIREHVTINIGTKEGLSFTKVGDNNFIMTACHIAHDCIIGSNVIMANNTTLGGHVEIHDNVVIGGLSAVHQFVKIGSYSMIGGVTAVTKDVLPYSIVTMESREGVFRGINKIGLSRNNFTKDEILAINKAVRSIYNDDTTFKERVDKLSESNSKHLHLIKTFIDGSSRGLIPAVKK